MPGLQSKWSIRVSEYLMLHKLSSSSVAVANMMKCVAPCAATCLCLCRHQHHRHHRLSIVESPCIHPVGTRTYFQQSITCSHNGWCSHIVTNIKYAQINLLRRFIFSGGVCREREMQPASLRPNVTAHRLNWCVLCAWGIYEHCTNIQYCVAHAIRMNAFTQKRPTDRPTDRHDYILVFAILVLWQTHLATPCASEIPRGNNLYAVCVCVREFAV